jgi:Tol biopolymer transport system component
LIVDRNGPLALIDPQTGGLVPPVAGTLPANGTMPSWSPDGNTIAFITNWVGSDSAHLTSGDLATLEVTAPDALGRTTILHHGIDLNAATPGGTADSYPTWSPDSRWIAFAHGNASPSSSGNDALYLQSITGGAPTRLDHACGGATTQDSYLPNFSPFNSGGYYWLSFLSRRDYGNRVAGTRGTGRQQIWIAAVANHPVAGTDPSEVGYWLPGQDTQSMNISAFWSPRPCRADAAACGVGSECCSGLCTSGSCASPPSTQCRTQGQLCGGNSDCCTGLLCIGNVCDAPPG